MRAKQRFVDVVWLWRTIQPARSEPAPNPCRGHTQVHFCSTSGIVCNMSDLRLDAQTNTDANTGVLCCP
jgi:hypothetical protein